LCVVVIIAVVRHLARKGYGDNTAFLPPTNLFDTIWLTLFANVLVGAVADPEIVGGG